MGKWIALIRYSAVELNTAIVCGTLPFTRQFLRGICPRLLRTGATPNYDSASGRKSSGFRRMPRQATFELESGGGDVIALESTNSSSPPEPSFIECQ